MPDWHHGPVHRLGVQGAYIVTASTLGKARLLNEPRKLSLVRDALFSLTESYGWSLQAWAVLCNHYHLVAHAPPTPGNLSRLLSQLHTETARQLNDWDGLPERRVWFQYYDTHITSPKSYLARVRYVNENPARHGVVVVATQYEWCSAPWYEQRAASALKRSLASFRIDQVSVYDDF